jgi:CheY-like chemotaxis protein
MTAEALKGTCTSLPNHAKYLASATLVFALPKAHLAGRRMQPPKPRILIVDDDARVRDMLRDVMATFGYDVDVAEDGRAGVEKFRERPVDVVVTDFMMPGITGLELAVHVRVIDPAVPIILLTGFATPAVLEEARRLRVTLLSKPIGTLALKAAIGAALGLP